MLLPSSSDDDDDEHTNSRLLPEEVRRKARRVLTEDGESIFQYSMNMPHPILEPHVLLANANGGSNRSFLHNRARSTPLRSLVGGGGSAATAAALTAGSGVRAASPDYSSSSSVFGGGGSSGYSSGGSSPAYNVPSMTDYMPLDLDLLSAADVQSTFVGLDFESELDKLLPSLELLNSNDGFGFEAISAGMPYNGSIWLSLRFTPPPHIGAKEMPFLVLYCQSKLFWDAMHTYLEEVQPAPSWGTQFVFGGVCSFLRVRFFPRTLLQIL